MPTPFYHLSVARELLEHPKLNPYARNLLKVHASDFLLGKTAPDVQVVSGQSREDTHFFTIPPDDKFPAWQRLMAAHAMLARSKKLPPDQAVFIAGYICHLQADEKWILEAFLPFFGPDAEWADFQHRLYLHNVLRAYMDQQVLDTLPEDIGDQLQDSRPNNWLPFVDDEHLDAWQQYLCEQLQPGAEIKTAEVFAERQGLSPEDITDLLASENRMEAEIFSNFPREQLMEFRRSLVADNLQLLEEYLPAS